MKTPVPIPIPRATRIVLSAFAALLSSPVALAGETGSIVGTVNDAAGSALSGVVVRISGPQLPAGRAVVTSDVGAYRFTTLVPGAYTVSADLQGLGNASRSVEVFVDREARLDLVLSAARDAGVVVTAETLDTRSSEVETNFQSAEIRELPLPRSYYGFLYLLPSAPYVKNTNGYVPAAGGTRQENKYLLDGVNLTNPGYGYIGIETNELDVADVNFKTGGLSAESGRTQGAVVNVVTRSGTNSVHGGLRLEASPSSLAADGQSDVEQDVDTWSGAANVGFPVLRDILFAYASARFAQTDWKNKATPYGTQPDTRSETREYFGKLTAYPAASVILAGGFRALPVKNTNFFGSPYDADSAAYGGDRTNTLANASATWLASRDTTLEAKYVHSTENPTYGAATVITDRPTTIDPLALGKYGAYYDPSRSGGNTGVFPFTQFGTVYRRDEAKLSSAHVFALGPTQHEVRLGGGAEFVDYDEFYESNGWGVLSYGAKNIFADYYRTQPKQVGRARTYSLFLQDTVTWGRLSTTLGLLANDDDFAQIGLDGTRYNFLTFSWQDQIQPRIGLVYNAGLLPADRLYTSFGIYSGLDLKSTISSFAPYRIQRDRTVFDRATGAFKRETVFGPSKTKYIPPDLAAPWQQEWVIGYSGRLAGPVTFDVHYQYKNLKSPFEDTPIDPNDYFNSTYQAKTFPDARRVYRGITLSLAKPYSSGWQASLTYTYSKLYGNWDEDFATGVYNTSSYLEDGPGWNSSEPNRYGRLGMDRPHVLKVFASADVFRFTVGAFFLVQSGLAWQAMGADSYTFHRYLEPAGSRRTPTVTNLDLLGAYTFDLGRGVSLRLEARVANVFDGQTPTNVDTVQYLDPYVDGTPASTLGPQGTSQPNPNFGAATAWVKPRQLSLTALLSF